MIILRKNRSQEYKIIFIEKNIMKRRKNMLVGSTKKFRISYYLSSFIPSYMFLLIILLVQHYETTSNFLPLTLKLTSKKVVFILILILFILSCLSLCYVKVVLKNISNNSSSRGIRQGYITRNYNVGMREFLLSVLIPIMTTISVQDSPITGLISMLFLQIILYLFYSNSSEYLPNVSIQLISYSVLIAIDTKDNREVYIFSKTEKVSDLVNGNTEFVYFGNINKNSQIGLIIEGEENEN